MVFQSDNLHCMLYDLFCLSPMICFQTTRVWFRKKKKRGIKEDYNDFINDDSDDDPEVAEKKRVLREQRDRARELAIKNGEKEPVYERVVLSAKQASVNVLSREAHFYSEFALNYILLSFSFF